MGRLQDRAKSLLTASVSENTALTYSTAVNSFDKFRGKYSLPIVWPANVQQVIMFISFCFETGLLPSTIATYISGLSFFHKLHGWEDFGEVFLIKKILEGCRRFRSHKDERSPITFKLLAEICHNLPVICYDIYEAKMFKAAFTLAYFGLFRISELVSKSQICSTNALRLCDIGLTKGGKALEVKLRVFKTNQLGAPTLLKIPCEQDDSVCPVCAMHEFLAIRASSYNGTLFLHKDGSLVTRSQFTGVLAKCIKKCSSHNGVYRSHSFRIGRATHLAAMGVPGVAIMKLGRWKSNAYLGYIRP